MDKNLGYQRTVTRSNPAELSFFIFKLEKILRSNLIFSTSYSRSTDLESLLGLLLVSFIWLEEKNSLKHLLLDGRTVVPPNGVDIAYVQTG